MNLSLRTMPIADAKAKGYSFRWNKEYRELELKTNDTDWYSIDGMMRELITAECYQCQHSRTIANSAYLRCIKYDTQITGDAYGIANGWFNYPRQFDPFWKDKPCRNFKERR